MAVEKSRWRHVTRADQLTLQRLFSHLPGSFKEKNEALLELRELFHEEMGTALQPHLRAQLKAQPQDTLHDRLNLGMSLRLLLGNLGLTLQCPESGEAVSLELEADETLREGLRRLGRGDPPRDSKDLHYGMRYVLTHPDPRDPDKQVTTFTSEQLPEITVRAAPPELFDPLPRARDWAKDTHSPVKSK